MRKRRREQMTVRENEKEREKKNMTVREREKI
jgi:hypothetical protein